VLAVRQAALSLDDSGRLTDRYWPRAAKLVVAHSKIPLHTATVKMLHDETGRLFLVNTADSTWAVGCLGRAEIASALLSLYGGRTSAKSAEPLARASPVIPPDRNAI
jgi:hypothetical protein